MTGPMNTMGDLLNHIFEQIETVRDADADELDDVVKRAQTVNDLAGTAVSTANVMMKAAKLQGYSKLGSKVPRQLGDGTDGE